MKLGSIDAVKFASREGWLAARQNSLGGSDVPALFGVGFRSLLEIQLQLQGKLQPSVVENDRFEAGSLLEPLVARVAARELELKLVRPTPAPGEVLYLNAAVPHAHATPDRLVVNELPDRIRATTIHEKATGVVSLKTASMFMRDAWEEGPTPYSLIQLQHEMLMTGIQQGWIVVTFGLGESFKTFGPFEPHPGVQGEIAERLDIFWRRCVEEGYPVPEMKPQDSRILNELYRRALPGSAVRLPANFKALVQARSDLQNEIKEAQAKVDEIEAQFKAALGEHEAGVIDDATTVFWKETVRNDPPRVAKQIRFRTLRVGKTQQEVFDVLARTEQAALSLGAGADAVGPDADGIGAAVPAPSATGG